MAAAVASELVGALFCHLHTLAEAVPFLLSTRGQENCTCFWAIVGVCWGVGSELEKEVGKGVGSGVLKGHGDIFSP